ncbi:hypothetical protein D3C78_1736660 [compost metagenome]
MAWQTHYAHVVRKVFAAKLCTQAQILGFFQQFLFQRHIAERLAVFVAFGWQRIIVFG